MPSASRKLSFNQAFDLLRKGVKAGEWEVIAWVLLELLPAFEELEEGKETAAVNAGLLQELYDRTGLEDTPEPPEQVLADFQGRLCFWSGKIQRFDPQGQRFLPFDEAVELVRNRGWDEPKPENLEPEQGEPGPDPEDLLRDWLRGGSLTETFPLAYLAHDEGDNGDLDRYLLIDHQELDHLIAEELEPDPAGRLPQEDPLAPFRAMKNLRFPEITLRVNVEARMMEVHARGTTANVRFHELGLTKGNHIELDAHGHALMALARGEWETSKKTWERLGAILKLVFATSDKPFEPWKRGGDPRFTLSVPGDVRAKKKAERRSFSYRDGS